MTRAGKDLKLAIQQHIRKNIQRRYTERKPTVRMGARGQRVFGGVPKVAQRGSYQRLKQKSKKL